MQGEIKVSFLNNIKPTDSYKSQIASSTSPIANLIFFHIIFSLSLNEIINSSKSIFYTSKFEGFFSFPYFISATLSNKLASGLLKFPALVNDLEVFDDRGRVDKDLTKGIK